MQLVLEKEVHWLIFERRFESPLSEDTSVQKNLNWIYEKFTLFIFITWFTDKFALESMLIMAKEIMEEKEFDNKRAWQLL